jgi:RNase P subunit RPR2
LPKLSIPTPKSVTNNIQKNENPFNKLVMSKKNVCINFSSQLRHICKMCNPFFAKVANCAIFQKTEKKNNLQHTCLLGQVNVFPPNRTYCFKKKKKKR